MISSCNNSSQNVLFTWIRECLYQDPSSIKLPPSILNTQCLNCNNGEYLHYDFIKNQLECSQCPKNTYSIKGNLSIDGKYKEWDSNNLSKFRNKCSIKTNSNSTSNCYPMTIDNSKSILRTGNAINNDLLGYQYISQLSITVTIKHSGNITFIYKKNTKRNNDNSMNGSFSFNVNYKETIGDNESNGEWIEKTIDLEPGTYSLLWEYSKTVNTKDDLELMMAIKAIHINGIETSALECIPCNYGYSKEGSDQCHLCTINQYYDDLKGICVDCPIDYTSPENSQGTNSCVEKRQCELKDYIALPNNNCDMKTTQTTRQYHLHNNQCKESLNSVTFPKDTMKCSECPLGKFWNPQDNQSHSACEDCPINTYTKTLDSTSCVSCTKTFLINTMSYAPQSINHFEIDNIKVNSPSGEIKVSYIIMDTNQPMAFNITIDNTTIQIESGNLSTVTLPQGNHYISIKGDNAAITQVNIINTEEGNGYKCLDCSNANSLESNDRKYCEPCDIGYEYDSGKRKCKQCKENHYKSSKSNTEQCQRCPLMTIPNKDRSDCIPLDSLTHNSHMQKYYLNNIRELQSQLCGINMICINDFIGPIKDTTDQLYYISFDSPTKIPIANLPFEVDNDMKHIIPAFVYSFMKKTPSKARTVYNLGSQLNSVKLVKGKDVRGIVFNYNQGDACLEDTNQTYESYLFLNCMKYQNEDNEEYNTYTSPRLIQKNKCKYYFEWSSSAACPLCLSNEVVSIKVQCSSTQSTMIFIEGSKCIINNSTNEDEESSIEYIDESIMLNSNDKEILDAYKIKDLIVEKSKEAEYYNTTGISRTCNITEEVFKEEETTPNEEKEYNWTMIIILVILGYITLVSIGVYTWFQYDKLQTCYSKLVEEPSIPMESQPNEQNNQNDPGTHQIELTVQSTKLPNQPQRQDEIDQPEIEVKIHHNLNEKPII